MRESRKRPFAVPPKCVYLVDVLQFGRLAEPSHRHPGPDVGRAHENPTRPVTADDFVVLGRDEGAARLEPVRRAHPEDASRSRLGRENSLHDALRSKAMPATGAFLMNLSYS